MTLGRPLVLVLAFSTSCGWVSGFTCSPGTSYAYVGSCMLFGCDASRGPAHCKLGKCFCNAGMCPYQGNNGHYDRCLQPTGGTCHVTGFCYNGGMTTTQCVKGYCMCRDGYHLENDKCENGYPTMLAANMTVAEETSTAND